MNKNPKPVFLIEDSNTQMKYLRREINAIREDGESKNGIKALFEQAFLRTNYQVNGYSAHVQ